MSLRCLLFSSDEATAEPIRQILADLGIEAEHCPGAAQAVERVTTQAFHLVIVDWDNQPEAGFLLNSARERKAAERPLTLAIVGNDTSVPQALQAGANSILRKPIQINQAKDTLTTARGFLRAKYEAAPAAQAAAAGASSVATSTPRRADETLQGSEKTLRAGEFLQSGTTPSTHFVTESEVPKPLNHGSLTEVDSLKELEPMAGSVEKQDVEAEAPLRLPDEPRGLAWYMKARPAPEPPTEPAQSKAELLSFSDAPGHSNAADTGAAANPPSEHEQRTEAALFAYISGESPEENEPKPRRKLGKPTIFGIVAAGLAIAYFALPQSVWRPRMQSLVVRAARTGHNWLNPQPVTTAPAPPAHENFGRAGDEYKLPVAENIPDATTDPSQIRVVPVVDPTAKPLNGANAGANQTSSANGTGGPDQTQTLPGPNEENKTQENQVQENKVQENQSSDDPPSQPVPTAQGNPPPISSAQTSVPSTAKPTQPDTPVASPDIPAQPPQHKPQPRSTPVATNSAIPSSLKSQMASTTPQAGGNKPVEAGLPSIEPVDLPEATARGLLLQQTDIVYPPSAKGQQGTVVLQLLIGRDGTVQDAKFLQGSLAFARAAIDAVKQWRFKPYLMNTHPVSVQTVLTLSFKPAT